MTSYEFERVLTTGGSGQLGSYVDFGMRPNSQELDVLDEEGVMRYVEQHRPHAIMHFVGATDMQKCESDPLYAYELNVRGTYNVALAARAVGATMVYVSTSRVFRGDKKEPYTEEDMPEPETHYGRTKYMGELVTKALVPQHIIARTAWVFGGGPERDNKFYGKVLQQIQSGVSEIVALDDVRGSPTYGKDFIATIKDLLGKGERGTFHIANAEVATRYDLASLMVAHLNSSTTVRAVDRSFFSSGSTLPSNESIVSSRYTLRPWKDALAEYLDEAWNLKPHTI